MLRSQEMPYLVSSHTWYKKIKMGGVFDADPLRNPWAGANMVYAAYCTVRVACLWTVPHPHAARAE